MANPRVAIVRISRGCMERTEIGTWLVACYANPIAGAEGTLEALDIIDMEPTPAARNHAVMRARANKFGPNDILIMIDNDMVPGENFYDRAVRFLKDYPGPTAFASPYRGAAPKRKVQVIAHDGHRYTTEEVASRRNIEQVAGIGTGLFACNMACFDAVEKAGLLPWFEYAYKDPPYNSLVESTEDIVFCDKLNRAGGRIYCDWESWAGHAKVEIVGKPGVFDPDSPQGDAFDGADLYARAVASLPEDRTSVAVEVGCYLGRSTICLANLIRQSGKPVQLFAVDHFRGSSGDSEAAEFYHRQAVRRGGGSYRAEFEENLHKAGVRDLVTIVEGDSAVSAAWFADDQVDFCFIDADHDEASVERDIRAWLPKIRPGGILAGHDYDWPTVRAAVDRVLPGVYPLGRSWLSIKSLEDIVTVAGVRNGEEVRHG